MRKVKHLVVVYENFEQIEAYLTIFAETHYYKLSSNRQFFCKDYKFFGSGERGTIIILTFDVKTSFLQLSDAAAEDQGNEEP